MSISSVSIPADNSRFLIPKFKKSATGFLAPKCSIKEFTVKSVTVAEIEEDEML